MDKAGGRRKGRQQDAADNMAVTEESDGAVPVLDGAVLERLSVELSTHDVCRLLGLFVRDLTPVGDAIATAVSASDLEALGREAHTLKSTAVTFGALRLARRALKIDELCKTGETDAAFQAAASLGGLIVHTGRVMSRYITEVKGA